MLENNYVLATNVPWGGGGDQAFKVILQVMDMVYICIAAQQSTMCITSEQ